ncbi:MAG: hypothetical protein Q9227_002153 [Pyrenula ochraceoflavens]
MLSFTFFIILLWTAFQAITVHSIPTISAVGSKFFTSDGQQWYMKGVAYQPSDDDPIANPEQCKRDVALMKEIGVNSIRVYHVDPKQDHRECMSALEDAGIYLLVDLDTYPTYIHPVSNLLVQLQHVFPHFGMLEDVDDPQDKPDWNKTGFEAYQAVLDEFQKFDNTAAVFVGNEVLDQASQAAAAPYVLAAARDVKKYRDQKRYRNIPVGYSGADIAQLRPMLQNYFACRPDPQERMDFFALNSYEWCGPYQTYTGSGYVGLQALSANYSIPIFFSETGCMTNPPRNFADQTAIFGPDMVNTWSGSIIYEWTEAANHYGLVNYGNSNDGQYPAGGNPTPMTPDFTNLKSQWATLSPKGAALSTYSTVSVTPVACPASSESWSVDASATLPTIGVAATVTGTPSPSKTSDAPTGSRKDGTSSGSALQAETTTGSGTAASHTGAAGKTVVNPFAKYKKAGGGSGAFSTMLLALIAVGMGFTWLL